MQLAESRSTIYSLEEEILVSTVKDGVVMTSADAKENFNVRQTLKLEYPIPFLMDIRNLPDMTIEAPLGQLRINLTATTTLPLPLWSRKQYTN